MSLSERLIYTAGVRCPCGYGFAYDRGGKIYTESGSPFAMRPDQWECAGTLLWRADELPADERERVLTAMHEHPLSFSDGPKGENREQSTREPIIPANNASGTLLRENNEDCSRAKPSGPTGEAGTP